jgi:hypothetical protein
LNGRNEEKTTFMRVYFADMEQAQVFKKILGVSNTQDLFRKLLEIGREVTIPESVSVTKIIKGALDENE